MKRLFCKLVILHKIFDPSIVSNLTSNISHLLSRHMLHSFAQV
jgi:hypothetical protein